jgi:hypothetical protein
MATTTAFTNPTEASLLNHLLRGTSFGPYGADGTSGTQLWLALMTNVASDATLAENALGTAAYNTRIALGASATTAKFGVGGTNAAATTATPGPLTNINAVSFTATGASITIAGIGICTSSTINATASTDATILFYGDITGGSVTLGSGQTITFPVNTGIDIRLD